jgi:hypothetical protein
MAGSGPVESPSPSHHLTGARQANRAARMHRDEELITVAEVQSFADLRRKNESTASSEVNPECIGVSHPIGISHIRSSGARLGRLLPPNANHE